jgi:hypothetical protein
MNPLRALLYRPRWHRLPVLPRMNSVMWTPKDIDADTSRLMTLTQTRCPQGVELLKRRYKVKTAHELITVLPPRRRRRDLLARLVTLYRRAMGVMPYDPIKQFAPRARKRTR